MSGVVFGIGFGIIILVTVWVAAICIAVVSFRTRKNIGTIALAFAALVTCLLLVIPLDLQKPLPKIHTVYDELFIWRTSLLVLLTISSGVGLFSYISHCMEPQVARHIKRSQIASICVSSVVRGEARHITSNDDFVRHVVNSSRPVVVTFHAEWCEPCKMLLPKLRALIEPLDEIELAVVDVEKHPELVESFEVKAVPAVVAMRNGTVVDKFIGLVDDKMITNLMGKLVVET